MAVGDNSSFEEDSYSVIFTALKHPVRRHILRMISGEPKTYTDLLKALEVESSYLTYHLDNLKPLVSKTDDGKYVLSSFGQAALNLMTGVEEPKRKEGLLLSKPLSRRILIGAPLLLIILASFVVGIAAGYGIGYLAYQPQISGLQSDNSALKSSYENLNTTYNELRNDFRNLNTSYYALSATLYNLNTAYNELRNDFRNLNESYCDVIKQLETLTDLLNYPVVRATKKDYNRTTLIDNFWNCSEWKNLSNKTVSWALDNLNFFIEVITLKSENLGLNSSEINQILNKLVYNEVYKDFGFFVNYSLTLLPCLVEKAKFNGTDAWIIVFNWEMSNETEASMKHIQIYVAEYGTQRILYFNTCNPYYILDDAHLAEEEPHGTFSNMSCPHDGLKLDEIVIFSFPGLWDAPWRIALYCRQENIFWIWDCNGWTASCYGPFDGYPCTHQSFELFP